MAIYDVKIVVSELSPLLLDPTFNLLPISFHSIPVHVNLLRSARDMAGEHIGLAIVPSVRQHRFVKLLCRPRKVSFRDLLRSRDRAQWDARPMPQRAATVRNGTCILPASSSSSGRTFGGGGGGVVSC